jgi:hypothetical protein
MKENFISGHLLVDIYTFDIIPNFYDNTYINRKFKEIVTTLGYSNIDVILNIIDPNEWVLILNFDKNYIRFATYPKEYIIISEVFAHDEKIAEKYLEMIDEIFIGCKIFSNKVCRGPRSILTYKCDYIKEI